MGLRSLFTDNSYFNKLSLKAHSLGGFYQNKKTGLFLSLLKESEDRLRSTTASATRAGTILHDTVVKTRTGWPCG